MSNPNFISSVHACSVRPAGTWLAVDADRAPRQAVPLVQPRRRLRPVLPMDGVVSSARVKYPYNQHGCRSCVAYYKARDHERVCPHAPCSCTKSSCAFVGSPRNLHATSPSPTKNRRRRSHAFDRQPPTAVPPDLCRRRLFLTASRLRRCAALSSPAQASWASALLKSCIVAIPRTWLLGQQREVAATCVQAERRWRRTVSVRGRCPSRAAGHRRIRDDGIDIAAQ